MKCPRCGELVKPPGKFCAGCGAKFASPPVQVPVAPPKKKRSALLAIPIGCGGMIALLFLIGIIGSIGAPTPAPRDTSAKTTGAPPVQVESPAPSVETPAPSPKGVATAPDPTKVETNATPPPVPVIVDVMALVGRSEKTLAKSIGKPASCEKGKYGRKCVYRKGLIEVTFRDGKADWITIDPEADMVVTRSVLARFALDPKVDPVEEIEDEKMTWSGIQDLVTVELFPDYLVVRAFTALPDEPVKAEEVAEEPITTPDIDTDFPSARVGRKRSSGFSLGGSHSRGK
jgi:hypothetical protein